MQCPLCIETALEARFYNNVEIDVCPKCKGVWLDRDELAKLSEPAAVRSEPARKKMSRDDDDDDDDRNKAYRDDDDDDRKKRRKRKKSLGERLVDALEDVLDDLFD